MLRRASTLEITTTIVKSISVCDMDHKFSLVRRTEVPLYDVSWHLINKNLKSKFIVTRLYTGAICLRDPSGEVEPSIQNILPFRN